MYCKWEKEWNIHFHRSSEYYYHFFFLEYGQNPEYLCACKQCSSFSVAQIAQAGGTISCRLVPLRRRGAVERDRTKTGSVVLLVRFPELQRFMSWLLIYWTCSSICHSGTQPETAYLLLTGHCAAFHSLWSSRPRP